MRQLIRSFLLLFCLLGGIIAHAADAPIPALTARVTDTTGTLNQQQLADLESRLTALEQKKGAQLVVLMVPSTQPEAIEDYTTRVFEQWKLGRKNVDDGVLLVVAKNDRRVRIEVGYGLEGAITDSNSGRIIREYIAPGFRQNDYDGGISAAVNALSQLIEGEALPAPLAQEQVSADNPLEGLPQVAMFGGVILGIIVLVVGAIFRLSAIKRTLVALIPALGLGWFFSGSLIGAIVCAAIAAGIASHLAFYFLGSFLSGGGRYVGGGGSGGGFSGGGGGGFSGGGGSSGGGGASGSW